MFKRILVVLLAFAGVSVGVAATQRAQADQGTVVVNHPGWPDRSFSISVDGPVVLTWAGVSEASGTVDINGVGCVVDHGSDPHIVGAYSAICNGPGTIFGETQIYADPDCVDGQWLYKMLVVAADGVVVFDDRAHGDCVATTTSTTIFIPPTTTIAPTPTTLAPGTRYCAQWANKPTHHCVRYATVPYPTTTTVLGAI